MDPSERQDAGFQRPEADTNNDKSKSASADYMNNFNALRFWAAIAVLWSHSFPLSYGDDSAEPLWIMSRGQTTIGGMSVGIFFVISGYLITQSFQRSATASRFILARVLRLLPALVVVVFLLAFVIGPLITTIPISNYFNSSQTYHFFLYDISLLKNYNGLPGVFPNNPMPYVVNGSLWTLHLEAGCYIFVGLVGVLRLLNRYVIWTLFIANLCLVAFFPHDERLRLCAFFLSGSAFRCWQPPLDGRAVCVAVALVITSLFFGGYERSSVILLPYVVMFLALSPSVRMVDMAQFGDFSYGIYIYAFPVQQIAAMLLPRPEWWSNGLISTPLVLGLAIASWHLVERPSLKFKDVKTRPFSNLI